MIHSASRVAAAGLFLTVLIGCQVGVAEAATRYSPRSYTSYSRLPSSARREIQKLQREHIEEHLRIPVLFNAPVTSITDSWGDPRSGERTHEGTDILAPRGTPVVSPTDAVLTQKGTGDLGGTYVYTLNPGGEQYYFAHLDAYADDIKVGQILKAGDVIGYVGNTGDAAGGPTHLHFTIYKGGAINAFPRLTEEFTLAEKIDFVKDMLDDADDEDKLADQLVAIARTYFIQANMQGLPVPEAINAALIRNPAPVSIGTGVGGLDLDVGSTGTRVALLQSYLISAASGPQALVLAKTGATGTFGPLTKFALIEYQTTHGISPASGYFGPVSRAYFAAHGMVI